PALPGGPGVAPHEADARPGQGASLGSALDAEGLLPSALQVDLLEPPDAPAAHLLDGKAFLVADGGTVALDVDAPVESEVEREAVEDWRFERESPPHRSAAR